MIFERVLLTGAAGAIGSCLREGLRGELDELRLSDVSAPDPPAVPPETFAAADLTDREAVRRAVEGVEAVVHLGAVPNEAPFDELLGPNVLGTFNVFDAARRTGVRRVVYASSSHVTGFYRVGERLRGHEPPRPDGLYGVTKVFGEALARMYSDRFGIEAICLRIGAFAERPVDPRQLATWLSPGDALRLFRACLTARDVNFLTVYGVSANTRSWWDLTEAERRLGYEPRDDAERFAPEIEEPVEGPRYQGDPFTAPGHGGWE